MKVELYGELSTFVLLIKIKMLLCNKKESKCSIEQFISVIPYLPAPPK